MVGKADFKENLKSDLDLDIGFFNRKKFLCTKLHLKEAHLYDV